MTDLGPSPASGPISLAQIPEFCLAGMTVRPAELAVEMNGEIRDLQPRVMKVLIALAEARPAVLSRERLAERCWEGRIVGDDALNRCIVALRHIAKEFEPEPFTIETVARVGYSLVEARASVRTRPWLSKRVGLAALLALVLIGGGLAFALSQFARGAEPASIAVLPFRNLSNGDAFFAEGVGEEIMGQLAREPAFQVAGRASAAQFSGPSDPRKVGQALHVDYILEGSVRSGGDRVRINAALIRTRDGMRLWSDTYDRNQDDILEIQGAIGQAVADGLKRKLIHSGVGAAPAVNGEAYALYLNARGLLRSQSPQVGGDAVAHLKQAIRLDPNFAPAWSSLAEALQLESRVKGTDALIDAMPRAQGAARRALQLDPKLAQAYGALGPMVPKREGRIYLRRAAELDPKGGEGLMWLAASHYMSGEFAQWLDATRRAHEIDPPWPIPVRSLIDISSVMADRSATEKIVRRAFPDDPILQQFALGRVAWTYGDFSEAARLWSNVAKDPEGRWAPPARLSLEDLAFMLRLSNNPPSRPPTPRAGRVRWGPSIWMTAPPSPAEWQKRNRSQAAALVNLDENIVAAKLMLNAGRARELAATYDSPTGLLNIKRGESLAVCLEEAAIAALALRNVGRGSEADVLLRQADGVLRTLYRRGQVPAWLHWEAASVWALQGKSEPAVKALERSLQRGWGHGRRGDLPKLEDEPALRSLRGNPRFEALRSKYAAHYARERAETARELKISVS